MRIIKPSIFPIEYTDGDKKAAWDRIKNIHHETWKAANEIICGQYFNDVLMRKLVARKPDADKAELENVFSDFFGVKRQATTERDIKAMFPALPPCVTNRLNNDTVSVYRRDKADVMKGNRAVRNYKRNLPIPVTRSSIAINEDEKGYTVSWKLSRKEKIVFAVNFGRDRGNYRGTFEKIVSGALQFSAPSFIFRDRDIFISIPVDDKVEGVVLDDSLSVGVDLGINIPAYCALSRGHERQAVGHRDDFLRVRTQMQERVRRARRAAKIATGGKGRKDKLSALNRFEDKERDFVQQYNHSVSRAVVDFAVKNGAGVIKLECLEGFSKEDRSNFILRNWSYFELQTQIKYKADRYGIKVVQVDPYHTSQMCSGCGHYEAGQRISQAEFVCKSCGAVLNADYNAAVNIARSDKVVSSAVECEYNIRAKALRSGTRPNEEGNIHSLTSTGVGA